MKITLWNFVPLSLNFLFKIDKTTYERENKQHLFYIAWWRYQMETFSALLGICAGNPLVSSEFPTQRPVTQSFDVFFDLRLNERLSKHSWGW